MSTKPGSIHTFKNMEGNNDDLLTGVNVYGVKHFALWPLSPAAQSCFGTEKWL